MLTPAPPTELDLHGSFEGGDFGWRRALVGVGNGSDDGSDRFRVEGNFTTTDGWRDATAYDRSSGTARWDHVDEHSWWKTVVAYSGVDQDTGANSPLIRADYENDPTRNYLPIAFREVGALRVSSDLRARLRPVAGHRRSLLSRRQHGPARLVHAQLRSDAVAHREPLVRRDGEVAARLRFARRALDRRSRRRLEPGRAPRGSGADRAHRLGRLARLHRLHAGRSRLRLRRHLPRRPRPTCTPSSRRPASCG